MTRVVVMQPYLFPALSYLQLAHAADDFVFYDDAQFSHGRWTHRNRICVGGALHLFTVPLAGRGPGLALRDIALHPQGYDRWRRKFVRTIRQAYARAPFAEEILPGLETLLAGDHATLADLAAASVRWLAAGFGITARWTRASRLDYDRTASAQDKVLAMVATMDGADYVNMPGGRDLYDRDAFGARGVRLGFMENHAGHADGLDLSALHVAMHRPPVERADLAACYAIDWDEAA